MHPCVSERARSQGIARHLVDAIRARIVFYTDRDDADLAPRDRLVLPPHNRHAATISAEGMRCVKTPRHG